MNYSQISFRECISCGNMFYKAPITKSIGEIDGKPVRGNASKYCSEECYKNRRIYLQQLRRIAEAYKRNTNKDTTEKNQNNNHEETP